MFKVSKIIISIFLVGVNTIMLFSQCDINNCVLDYQLSSDLEITKRNMITLDNGFSSGSYDFKANTDSDYNPTVTAPTSQKNYTRTLTPRVEMSSIEYNSMRDIHEVIEYYDGLERLEQTNMVHASPSGKDIIQPVEYDEYGRQQKFYLPYSADLNGMYDQLALHPYYGNYYSSSQYQFYQTHADFAHWGTDKNYPYAEVDFDDSPINMITSKGAPGQDWQLSSGHAIENNRYDCPSDRVIYWEESNGRYGRSGYYHESNLWVSEVIDEDGNITREYVDKVGSLIMTEAVNAAELHQTYYMYDDFGRQKGIIPPEAVAKVNDGSYLTNDQMDAYCYRYEYDERGRLIGKKVPGSGWVYMCYDKRDRLVASQNGNQRDNEWFFMKYDQLNRPVLSGIYSTTKSQTELQTEINGYNGTNLYEERGASVLGYTCKSFPNTLNIENNYLSATYYDTYSYPDRIYQDFSNVDFLTSTDLSSNTKGLITGSKTKIMDPDTDMPDWLSSSIYYDKYSRVIQAVSQNHLGGTDRISNHLNFAGELLESYTEHGVPGNSVTLENEFTYDHTGRILEEYSKVNSESQVKVKSYVYNETGQVKTIYTHMNEGETTSEALQATDYKYNIRGWLESINDPGNLGNDVFAMKLAYNNDDGLGNGLNKPACYNGNISVLEWKSKTDGGNRQLMAYGYTYDNLNQLKSADFGDEANWATNKFDIEQINYDKNGNITNLQRRDNDGSYMDDLLYDYSGNQLLTVSEEPQGSTNRGFKPNGNSTPYAYDANGNMTHDYYKNMSITRNKLNLPKQITKGTNEAKYYYTAEGAKLRVKVDEGTSNTVDYVGGFVYNNNQLSYIGTTFGRIVKVSGSFDYEYHARDQLGNTRVSYRENGSSLDVVQLADYYPFGNKFDQVVENNDNKYLFNGKEYQDYFNGDLNWYDFGARYNDAILGRWHSVDPVMQFASPYIGIGNNPVNLIDPDGMASRPDTELLPSMWDPLYKSYYDANDPRTHMLPRPSSPYGNWGARHVGPLKEDIDAWLSGPYQCGVSLSDFLAGRAVDITGNGDWILRDGIEYTLCPVVNTGKDLEPILAHYLVYDGSSYFSLNFNPFKPDDGPLDNTPVFDIEASAEAGLVAGTKFKIFGFGAEGKLGVSKQLVKGSISDGVSYRGNWTLNAALGVGPGGISASKSLSSEDASLTGNLFLYEASVDIEGTNHSLVLLDLSTYFGVGGNLKIFMNLGSNITRSGPDPLKGTRVDKTYVAPNY